MTEEEEERFIARHCAYGIGAHIGCPGYYADNYATYVECMRRLGLKVAYDEEEYFEVGVRVR